eukprot:4370912-Prymnesium_polylepis.1
MAQCRALCGSHTQRGYISHPVCVCLSLGRRCALVCRPTGSRRASSAFGRRCIRVYRALTRYGAASARGEFRISHPDWRALI